MADLNKEAGAVATAAELETELRLLRTVLRQAGEQFILRREGEIETVLGCLPDCGPPESIGQWLQALRQLRLKPNKGRLRDLKAIKELLSAMAEEAQDFGANAGERSPLRPVRKSRGGKGS